MESTRNLMGGRRVLVVLALILSAPATSTAPAGAAASSTQCSFEMNVVVQPGLTSSPSSGTITTNGETGTVSCKGPVNGKDSTGEGTAGMEGTYGTKDGDSCQSGGEGQGVESFTIPTASGDEHIKNNFTYSYGAFKAGALSSGTFSGDRMSGTFEAEPMDGDCASVPVTKFHVTAVGTLK
jgi:hypothetical protein